MANTMQTPAKPTDLIADVVLGTQDDSAAIMKVMAQAMKQSNKLTDGTYFWVDFRVPGTPLFCETSIKYPGSKTAPCKNLAIMYDVEARTLGPDPENPGAYVQADQFDVLGNARDRRVRNRAGFLTDWSQHCKMTMFKYKGPHTAAMRNQSIQSVLEQQCGVWRRSDQDFEMCAGLITDVWGDNIGHATAEVNGIPCERSHIWGMTFGRNGRETVLLTGCGAADIHDNTVLTHTKQVFHSESGGRLVHTGPWKLHHNLVLGHTGKGGYFLHVTGGSAPGIIWVQKNILKGEAMQIFVDPSGEMPDPTEEKVKELWVLENEWNRAPDGGYLLNARDITEVHYRWNKGYKRKIQSIAQQIYTERCDVVDLETAGITNPA
jgi:hypothetical protein